MESKLQEITSKIYSEGIEKANSEAENILKNAKEEAEKIKAKAQQESSEIINKAKADAESLKNKALEDVKKSGDQSIKSIKSALVDMITFKLVDESVKKALNKEEILETILLESAKAWKDSGEFSILVSEDKKSKLQKSVKSKLEAELSKKISIEGEKIPAGFIIDSKGAGYQIKFTDKEFVELISQFVKPEVAKILFE